jgi:TolB-like protein
VQLVEHPDKIAVWALRYIKGLSDLLHLRAMVLKFVGSVCVFQSDTP